MLASSIVTSAWLMSMGWPEARATDASCACVCRSFTLLTILPSVSLKVSSAGSVLGIVGATMGRGSTEDVTRSSLMASAQELEKSRGQALAGGERGGVRLVG